ncbi:transposase [Deinococcus sp.]|uniref:transposase n=1 Tax=Deinococcus sp. TaxID=47478 RepID=UPI0038D3C4E7
MTNALIQLLDGEKCFGVVRQHRWPGGVDCPHCHSPHVIRNQGALKTNPSRASTKQDRTSDDGRTSGSLPDVWESYESGISRQGRDDTQRFRQRYCCLIRIPSNSRTSPGTRTFSSSCWSDFTLLSAGLNRSPYDTSWACSWKLMQEFP